MNTNIPTGTKLIEGRKFSPLEDHQRIEAIVLGMKDGIDRDLLLDTLASTYESVLKETAANHA